MRAMRRAALAVACACTCWLLPQAASAAEIDLGVSVQGTASAEADVPAGGGSIDLAVAVQAKPEDSANEVTLGVNVQAVQEFAVRLVGYTDWDDQTTAPAGAGMVIEERTLRTGANLDGLPTSHKGADGTEYAIDGWYAYGSDGMPVALDASYRVSGTAVIFCRLAETGEPERPDDVISVTAPFRVAFQKGEPDAQTGSVAYSPAELEPSASAWVESVPQAFVNNSRADGEDADVYVAAIECIDVRASDFFPARASQAADGSSQVGSTKNALWLYRSGSGGKGAALAEAPALADGLRFGWVKDASYLVENGDANALVLAHGRNDHLYFGLDLREVAFDETALFAGVDESGRTQYDAQLANVKYTYRVIPSGGEGA